MCQDSQTFRTGSKSWIYHAPLSRSVWLVRAIAKYFRCVPKTWESRHFQTFASLSLDGIWVVSRFPILRHAYLYIQCTSMPGLPDDLDRGSAELLKRTVGLYKYVKTTVQTQMQIHILGPRIAKGQHVVWVILVSCALYFWCSLWWKHAGPKCLGFVWQKTSAAAALVSYTFQLAFFGWSHW